MEVVLKNKSSVIEQFDTQAQDYDNWFIKHPDLFQVEVEALKK